TSRTDDEGRVFLMIALLSLVYEVQLLYARTQTSEGNVVNFEIFDVPFETSRLGQVFC
nr:hypothetical protein [Tanacetum cinerariifolium]